MARYVQQTYPAAEATLGAPAVYRVRVQDGMTERILGLDWGRFSLQWAGLAADDSMLVLDHHANPQIYRFEVKGMR